MSVSDFHLRRGGKVKVVSATKASALWYSDRVNEQFTIERVWEEGVYVRTGDRFNTGNIIYWQDLCPVTNIESTKGN